LAPDGKAIATALTKENFLQPMIWDTQTVQVRGAHAEMNGGLAFFPSSAHFLTVAHDGTIKCFNARTGNESWDFAE
jgi:WD40 repeat protein